MSHAVQRFSVVAAIIAASLFASNCRSRVETVAPETIIAGEPESYSATVVRTIEDGDRREVIESRTCRMGDMRREEWIESSERRALISRPDLNRSFLLSLDQRLYVETILAPEANQTSGNATDAINENGAKELDRAFASLPPDKTETRFLADETIDGHPCQVAEKRDAFAGGREEVSRIFLARDLAGLALRIETQSLPSRIRITTERRNVQTRVSADEFTVPADFKRVERLP
ncbi:MAG TPA: hypothetical protein VID27_19055 [Blastocatellia bacterium]|jgi:hypothetical protein